MTFTFQLSLAEQYRAAVAVSRRTENERLRWIAFPLLGLLLLCFEALTWVSSGFQVSWRNIVIALLLVAVMPATVAYQARIVRRKNTAWSGPLTFSLNDEGIRIISAHTDLSRGWKDITRVVETRSFFLFSATGITFFLPKRVMTHEELLMMRG